MPLLGKIAVVLACSLCMSGCRAGQSFEIASWIARGIQGPVDLKPGGEGSPAGGTEASAEASPAPIPPLEISRFDPPTVWAGELLEISGQGFSSEPAENTVVLQPGASADIRAASERMLLVGVPLEARSGEVAIRRGDRVATASLTVIPRLKGAISQ